MSCISPSISLLQMYMCVCNCTDSRVCGQGGDKVLPARQSVAPGGSCQDSWPRPGRKAGLPALLCQEQHSGQPLRQ
jgi:hypothetical protein